MDTTRTQVGIVGAGPAGLLLSHLLHRAGIASVVLETRSRSEIESTLRAAVLEQGTVDLLRECHAGERMLREGFVHHGIYLLFEGERHRIALSELTGGRAITIYPQHEVIKDLIKARLDARGVIVFEAKNVLPRDIEGSRPSIDYETGEGRLVSTRSPEVQRLYFQCDPHDEVANWPDERIWQQLEAQLATNDGWTIERAAIFQKGIIAMRSFVAEPMQFGSLFLAGDAAHIVPPTGAKGMNLAVADVCTLSLALGEYYETGTRDALHRYSQTALDRVWAAEHFSWWMTMMLHRYEDGDAFQQKMQRAQLRHLVRSRALQTALAESYVGLPMPRAAPRRTARGLPSGTL